MQNVDIKTDIKCFWTDIGRSLQIFNNAFRNQVIESASEFASGFYDWKYVVIFVDEFDRLYDAIDEVRDSFLNCMRTIKHAVAAENLYPILSVIAVGTFGILELDSSENYDSPFNIRNPLQNPNLSREQVNRLFAEFESDQNIKIAPKVVEDIYFQTNGYVLQAKFGSLKSILLTPL